jgi:large subunit ribosomal protein L24
MLKIKKNDKVKVIQGKDKGKTGKVLRTELKDDKVYLSKVSTSSKDIPGKRDRISLAVS